MKLISLVTLCVLAATITTACPAALAQPGVGRVYAMASVGDNEWIADWPPIDSAATVNAMFETLAKTYRVKRMYWRGEEDRTWAQYFVHRRENLLYYEYIAVWLSDLHLTGHGRKYGLDKSVDDLAIAAARRYGMQIYDFDALFDHGAPGGTGGVGEFPYGTEDKLRIEHPEWTPVDRWGQRHATGPIELAYPAARQALVDRWVHVLSQYGYDGLGLYTYIENFGLRYGDEYGYNEPIVKEFKRRYGVDIRTQPFDKMAWYKLRGEYVTQFLRELHTALAARGKKLAITLRPGKSNNYPQVWSAVGTDLPGAGMIYLDWRAWIKAGIVDELMVYHSQVDIVKGDEREAMLRQLLEATRGTPVELTVLNSRPFTPELKPLWDAGVTPLTLTAPGYGIDRFTLETPTLASLRDADWRLRAQALADITNGTLKADAATVAPLTRDPHVLVRHQALFALAAQGATDQVPAVEACLSDPEHSVRVAAASVSAKLNGPQTPRRLLDMLQADGSFQTKMACIATLATMKERALPALLEGLRSPLQTVREVCVRVLGQTGQAMPELEAAARHDPDYRVRFFAVSGLSGDNPYPVLFQALNDTEPAVHMEAVRRLGTRAPGATAEQQGQILAALERLFREYGDGSKRSDAAWGWRVVGNSLLRLGQPAKDKLEAMRQQRQDKWLAWAAYLVLYVPQDASKPILTTEQADIETHDKFAPPFPGYRR